MADKIIDITCIAGHDDSIVSSAEHLGATLLSVVAQDVDPPKTNIRVFVPEAVTQDFLDRLQSQLPAEAAALVLLQSIDAKLPVAAEEEVEEKRSSATTREELYEEISDGAELGTNFAILAVLATIVAAIGLAEDNVAAVIAAMVIAPLLGPNLGLALGAALGDKDLIKTALLTNFVGVTLTIGLSALFAITWSPDLSSVELLSRTEVQLSSIVLALAAGIAAVLSVTSGTPSLLVGVMVAVALVPPASVLGMTLGVGQWSLAASAATLLAVNVIAVNFSAQLVFLLRGIRPRSWLERRAAAQSTRINLAIWASLLIAIAILVFISPP